MGTALGFPELLRYSYDLKPHELVIDAGGYDGKWASFISALYRSYIQILEPVPRFADLIRRRFHSNPKVSVREVALSTVSGRREFHINSNDSGFYLLDGVKVELECVDVTEVITGEVALLKMNIESEEFNILMRMLDFGLVEKCRDIQVQFHKEYPNANAVRERIRERLNETHYLTYDYPFVWENWRRK